MGRREAKRGERGKGEGKIREGSRIASATMWQVQAFFHDLGRKLFIPHRYDWFSLTFWRFYIFYTFWSFVSLIFFYQSLIIFNDFWSFCCFSQEFVCVLTHFQWFFICVIVLRFDAFSMKVLILNEIHFCCFCFFLIFRAFALVCVWFASFTFFPALHF